MCLKLHSAGLPPTCMGKRRTITRDVLESKTNLICDFDLFLLFLLCCQTLELLIAKSLTPCLLFLVFRCEEVSGTRLLFGKFRFSFGMNLSTLDLILNQLIQFTLLPACPRSVLCASKMNMNWSTSVKHVACIHLCACMVVILLTACISRTPGARFQLASVCWHTCRCWKRTDF